MQSVCPVQARKNGRSSSRRQWPLHHYRCPHRHCNIGRPHGPSLQHHYNARTNNTSPNLHQPLLANQHPLHNSRHPGNRVATPASPIVHIRAIQGSHPNEFLYPEMLQHGCRTSTKGTSGLTTWLWLGIQKGKNAAAPPSPPPKLGKIRTTPQQSFELALRPHIQGCQGARCHQGFRVWKP